jgi:carbon-monoxide dehydrogenase medium subunit
MYDTKFHKADSAANAASLVGSADDGKILAGGQTLIPTMKQRLAAPTDLVDITGIDDMRGITVAVRKKMGVLKAKGGETITIGAATTHAEVAGNADLRAACSSVADLAANIGDPAVRSRGTIGGSIANNDPAADYPAALLALSATITTNQRELSADDFFTGLFSTALNEDEIITSVSFQAPENGGYGKFPNPASRYAMVGVFAAKSIDGDVRVAVTGAGDDGVFRQAEMETALSSNWSSDAVAGIATSVDGLMSDIHGDATYRANLITVMAKRAVAAS